MTIFDELRTLLKSDDRLVSDEKLLKNKIVELALKLDNSLIKTLLSNKKIKDHFFTEVGGALIFDKDKFMKFVDNKEFLPDSYTAFKNKIGLTSGSAYLSKSKEVVLSWPYKDCVLEGGQEKEDEKRKEIFYNEILAPDEIDRLLEPKVFTNFKLIDAKGEHKITNIKPDDNLIIKGNNLLVLHSLKKKYTEKVKLIYIDPPFNTGSDEFQYNDKFNHSSWLAFIKNRLEVAKELLAVDGLIFVHIGVEEISYLNVLMDEIFGRENFLNKIALTTNDPSGFKATSSKIFSTANYILIYQKSSKANLNKIYIEKGYDTAYSLYLTNKQDHYSKWKWERISDTVAKNQGFKNYKEAKSKIHTKHFEHLVAEFAFKNKESVFRTAAISGGAKKKRQKTIDKSKKNRDVVIVHPNEDIENFYILNGEQILFYSDRFKEIDGQLVPAESITDVWSDISWTGIAPEGGITLKYGKKPEKLLKRIIDIATKEGDLILDFFAGSGTSGAVAHKIGRKYILVEQMHYIHELPESRLKHVIGKENSKGKLSSVIEDYDTTGISKEVNWKGGGSFVYCELKELNQIFVYKIKQAKDVKELLNIWKEMKSIAFLSYRVNEKLFDDNIEEFKTLELTEQKTALLECIDFNNLYVNYSEIDDAQYKIGKDEKEINHLFYGGL